MDKVVLAIVGWRNFVDRDRFNTCMQEWIAQYGLPDKVVSGGARGADTLAQEWATDKGIKIDVYKADWSRGRRAGLDRNTDIVDACTHMVAFPCAKGAGTQDSIRKAKAAGKVVTVHEVLS